MPELVALKVRIGLHPHGAAKYPDFGSLECVKASGQDWAHFIDREGSGWLYSKCGHKEHEEDSPFGEQWGMLLIPAEFATQAVAAFPAECTLLTDAEAGQFYEGKCCRDMPDVHHDADTLTAISAEITLLRQLISESDGDKATKYAALLGEALERAHQAVDPDHSHPGVRKNLDKCWDSHKAKRGFSVK